MQLPFDCPPHRSFVKGYNTLGFLTLEEVLPLITKEERHIFTVNGHEVDIKLSSTRLLPFIKSVKCYNPYCSEEGFVFAVQQACRGKKNDKEYDGWHINLYSRTGKLMTCDHIIPKSAFSKEERHGKANCAENLDTLCTVCNTKKLIDPMEDFIEKQRLASYFRQNKEERQEVAPEDFEGQLVGDVIKMLKKFPQHTRLALDKDGSGRGVPIIINFSIKPYAKVGTEQEPKQIRAFLNYSEV